MNSVRNVQNFSMSGGVGVSVLGAKELCSAVGEGGVVEFEGNLSMERGMSQWPRSCFWRGRVVVLV